MRLSAVLVCLLAVLLFGTGCGTVKKVGKATSKLVGGGKKVRPESEWNNTRTWRRVSDDPATYVPAGYQSADTQNGQWITDERDGKRFFIPAGGVDGLPESVLLVEAQKASQ